MRHLIRLLSSAGTGFAYYTTRRRAAGPPLALVKHDPVVRRHVVFTEAKMPNPKAR
ncbi:MAG: 50S ribosomal protein L33 [Myxococcales bacterium]|nr:50S ribosomal protein L33 [Myxococcales bacterium]